jgi:hypothetical protein
MYDKKICRKLKRQYFLLIKRIQPGEPFGIMFDGLFLYLEMYAICHGLTA